MGRIEILAPADNTLFDIAPGTAATGPQMPVIAAWARIVGVIGLDPTPTTQFTWTVQVRFQASGCAHGPNRAINDDFSVTAVGPNCTINFPRVRGGDLTLFCDADLPDACLESHTNGLKIRGTNPLRTELNTALTTQTLRQIAVQESRQRQFIAAANGGVGECPLWSGDNLGGVGLFQITRPAPTDDEVWDWLANSNQGIHIFNQKMATARGYPRRVRNSQGFRDLVTRFNAARGGPPIPVALPDFTAAQLDDDTVRGYNGWAGRDGFGHELHEFRVARDAAGNLVVAIDPTTGAGTAQWERVPVADRPQRTGDPDYVNHVRGRTP
jgi:hypothetical protein